MLSREASKTLQMTSVFLQRSAGCRHRCGQIRKFPATDFKFEAKFASSTASKHSGHDIVMSAPIPTDSSSGAWPLIIASLGGVLGFVHAAGWVVKKDVEDLMAWPHHLMQSIKGPATDHRKRVVVLGSGWGALAIARKLDPKVFDVTIISPRPYSIYTPRSAGVASGAAKPHSVFETVRQFASTTPHANYMKAECTDANVEKRMLQCRYAKDQIEVPYDHLVIAMDAQADPCGVDGVQEHAMFLKELNDGTEVRRRILKRLEQANKAHRSGRHEEVKKLLSVAIVGGGPTGVEFAVELADFINTDVKRSFPHVADLVKVNLLEALPGVLPMFDKKIGEEMKDHLNSVGVDVCTETFVKRVDDGSIRLAGSGVEGIQTLEYGALVWTAETGARPYTRKLAAAFGESNPGGIEVDPFMRVKAAQGNDVTAVEILGRRSVPIDKASILEEPAELQMAMRPRQTRTTTRDVWPTWGNVRPLQSRGAECSSGPTEIGSRFGSMLRAALAHSPLQGTGAAAELPKQRKAALRRSEVDGEVLGKAASTKVTTSKRLRRKFM